MMIIIIILLNPSTPNSFPISLHKPSSDSQKRACHPLRVRGQIQRHPCNQKKNTGRLKPPHNRHHMPNMSANTLNSDSIRKFLYFSSSLGNKQSFTTKSQRSDETVLKNPTTIQSTHARTQNNHLQSTRSEQNKRLAHRRIWPTTLF